MLQAIYKAKFEQPKANSNSPKSDEGAERVTRKRRKALDTVLKETSAPLIITNGQVLAEP